MGGMGDGRGSASVALSSRQQQFQYQQEQQEQQRRQQQQQQRNGMVGFPLAMNRDGAEDLGRWAVVSGFTPGDYTSPIRALQQYGQITAHRHGGGSSAPGQQGSSNFLFVQFATGMDRDHAVAIGTTFINASVVITVMPLTPDNAEKFRFRDAMVSGAGASTRDHQDLSSPSPFASPSLSSSSSSMSSSSSSSLLLAGGSSASQLQFRSPQPTNRARMLTPHSQGRSAPGPYRRRPYQLADQDGQVVEPPRRHVNICKQIMRVLFGW